MNLAVHGLSGDIREANTYYDDPHQLVGKFDFLMSNPPFNQSDFDRTRLLDEAGRVHARFPLGLPNVNNANYLWINLYYAALNATGRAGFVMANSAATQGAARLRRRIVEQVRGLHSVICTEHVPDRHLPVTLLVSRSGEGTRRAERQFCSSTRVICSGRSAHRVLIDQIEFLAASFDCGAERR
jgi:type I restriction enzyme M protein